MKKNSLGRILLVTAITFSATNVIAQTKNEFSVKQAVDYGLKNSAQVKNALLDIKIQQQVNKEVTSAAYPQLNATGTVNDYIDIPTTLVPAEFFGGTPGTYAPVKFGTKYTAGGEVDLQQILFDGQVFVGLQAKNTVLSFQSKAAEITQEKLKANIFKVYYELVVGQKQMASLDANIDRYNKLLNDTKEIYKNGFAEKLDVDKVDVQLNNIKTQRESVSNQLLAGYAGLKFLLNMPQKDSLVLTDTLSDDELKSNILDEAYNPDDNKEVQLAAIGEKMNEYNVKRYQLSRIPTLSLSASYIKNAQRTSFDFFDKKGDWYITSFIGLKLAIPIFNGFMKSAKIMEAKYTLEQSKNSLLAAKDMVDYNVTQSRTKMKSAMITMDNQKQNTGLAEQVYTTTKKKYEQGLGSNQEIYDAQTELQVAQNNYYNSVYDAISAKVDYLQATGKL